LGRFNASAALVKLLNSATLAKVCRQSMKFIVQLSLTNKSKSRCLSINKTSIQYKPSSTTDAVTATTT